MKGQSSLELLITLGIVLAFTIPVLFLLLSITSVGYENTAIAQAEASSRSLADTMNFVYAQGAGAKRLLMLNTPASTEEIYASNGEAIIRIATSTGPSEAASPTFAEILGGSQTVGMKSGLFVVVVENDGGKVRLRDPNAP